MRLSVIQSNYIPWIGYFELFRLSEITVILDSVQYTKNDWRNRNRIGTPRGVQWLTIPVRTAGKQSQRINEVQIMDGRWSTKHLKTIGQGLGKQPFFSNLSEDLEQTYQAASELHGLHEVNMLFLQLFLRKLGLATKLIDDRALVPEGESATARLVDLCKKVGATHYLSGPSALNYLEVKRFTDSRITLEILDYGQLLSKGETLGIDPRLSIVDSYSRLGPSIRDLFLGQMRSIT